ncbi:CTR1 [Candida pseudojiufengensis]|uniref:CTR1 n=1 Tax=Candida pseudojiufengensis TaxID=497109 RepID=UPI002224B5C2|nr:CTR1 [Candida pseudojiufengensis]KAI5962994.1 CTR1 [Candida pseudojiufengensis]
MSFYNRHAGHDHGSTTMDMASMVMSSTMDMVMETTAAAASSMSHDHGDEGMGMHMWFTTQFKDYPVLFKNLSASSKAEAFGIFVLLFFAAFFARFLEFIRNYLEEVVWNNDKYVEFENGVVNHSANLQPTTSAQANRSGINDESIDKNMTNDENDTEINSHTSISSKKSNMPVASTIVRDAIRLVLCIVPDLFGYTLMLAAMTYTLVYFFAVVIGSGVGRFASERLMEKYRIKRSPPRNCC